MPALTGGIDLKVGSAAVLRAYCGSTLVWQRAAAGTTSPPSFGSAGAYLSSAFTGTAAVPAPASVAAGDIILVHVHRELSTAPTSVESGFTEIDFSGLSVAGSMRQYVFWKRSTGTEPASYTFTWATATTRSGVATRWTGVAGSGIPFEVLGAAGRASSGTTTPAVSGATLGTNRTVVWTGHCWAQSSWTPPTGYTERADSGSANVTVASVAQPAAGSTGSVTGVSSVADYQTATLIALLPAAGATPATGFGTAAFGSAPFGR